MGKKIYLTDRQIMDAIGEYVIRHKLLTKSFSSSMDYDVRRESFSKTSVHLKGMILVED